MAGIALAGTNSGKAGNPPADKPDMTAMYQSFISKFADNLGVTEDQVKEALKETQLQMIDGAVEAGTITQDQAGKMIEKINSGEDCGFIGFGFCHGPGGHGPGGEGKGPGSAPVSGAGGSGNSN
ncbi:MAG TPA: hypothetical protein DCK76_00265 [Desulfotomaculum sp.]|nr:hypothetical protein [Desulfotomaculum sp.]HBY03870.1 hypothetical protein [Desulfotomaculum sp.]